MGNEGNAPKLHPPVVSPDGVLFLYSPRLGLRIRYGSLVIDAGRNGSLKVDRASEPRIRRLIIAGRGWWSFEVPAWLEAIGASRVQLNLAGDILGSGPGTISPDQPALRRRAAMLAGTEGGIAIAREQLTTKLAAQAANLERVDTEPATEAREFVRRCVSDLATCRTIEELRAVEARAAGVWWQAVAPLPMRFIPSDVDRVPESWTAVGRRGSAITGAPRKATSPAHAAWNFAYVLAATECEVALRGVGLDAGISPSGMHADTINRSGATWDLVETIRGDVDRAMLAMFAARRFRRRDFVQRPDGRVRLTAPLARELAEAIIPLARQSAAPAAEALARSINDGAQAAKTHLPGLPTNLTGEARSRGRDRTRRAPRRRTDVADRIAERLVPQACIRCGLILDGGRRRRFCDDCLLGVREESKATFAAAGPAKLAKIREQEGLYPVQRPEVRERIGRSQSERRLADLAWDAKHPRGADPEEFEQLVPSLQALPLRVIAEATGLSLTAARAIRNGKAPHPRHWEELARLEVES
jgi:CRISPR/Cas system-associated endonuclease Cas1